MLDWTDIVLRLGVATLAGCGIGLNRDLHGKPIGLRTLGLVGLAVFNAVNGLDWRPLGILADFVDVDPEYEALVEDFLRWKLQYVVVEDRTAAEKALDNAAASVNVDQIRRGPTVIAAPPWRTTRRWKSSPSLRSRAPRRATASPGPPRRPC